MNTRKRKIRYFCYLQLFRKAILLLFIGLLPGIWQQEAHAETNYFNYYMNPENMVLPVPAPYEPDHYFNMAQEPDGAMKNPQDLFIDTKDHLYIADTGNQRILAVDRSGVLLNIIGQGKLNQPNGVFVDDNEQVYVADTGNKRIAVFAGNGDFLREYPAPASPLLGKDFVYQPIRVIVDSRNYLYVVNKGNQQGLVMLDSEGQFRGFFGANRVQTTFTDMLLRLVYTKEQRRGNVVKLPYSFNNVVLSDDGFVYTTTTGLSSKQVRKLNAVGSDVMPGGGRDYADPSLTDKTKKQNFMDAAIDQSGNMTVLDKEYGRMYQYDVSGRMLFAFGDRGFDFGKSASPASIDVDSQGVLYVLDETKNGIQTYMPTRFTKLVHEANQLYNEGRYEQAVKPWSEVLKLNSYYEPALQAIGQSLQRQGRNAEAMHYFQQAHDKAGYSDAYHEKRRLLVRTHFEQAATPAVAGIAVLYILLRLMRSKGISIKKWLAASPLGWFRLPIWVMFHPVQGFEALRYENKGRVRDAFILVILYLAVKVMSIAFVGFLYEDQQIAFVDWTNVVLVSIVPWLLWSICNYGLTTISGGEGRFRDVLVGTAYCLTPWIICSLPLALLSRILTLQEQNFYELFERAMNVWVLILLFFKVKETHDYSVGKTLWIMFSTLVGCLAVSGLFLIITGMSAHIIEFVRQLVKEVIGLGFQK
ncbi:YIP1 family protein [Paenibacillus eucommiae]|uniref:Tetratricopeptide (TPR) repeat protein n=1 Tax=Paenibacillus eucommiae TaxID=1355755 RepID=A0ABS4IPD5_9BACL|nr:YIP1 family protein [Paenibacillus eucommiae]MBP1988484.1 tetratricopeptide (TPR) repeat protein [Paenibacillus eucommiae]